MLQVIMLYARAGIRPSDYFEQVSRITNRSADSKSSTSMSRAPADHSTFIRGKSGYFPFAPGGLATSESSGLKETADIIENMEKGFELTSGGIQTIPPGFERGLDFSGANGITAPLS